MVNRWLLLIGAIIGVIAILIILAPGKATATTTGEDASSEVWMNQFTVYAHWTYTSYDNIDIRLFHNNIDIADNNGNTGFSGTDSGYVSFSPVQSGTYMVQLYSTRDNKQVFSKSWVVPNLGLDLSVSPTSGQIGTTFVATATFSTGPDAPDDYSFSGALEFNAGGILFQQNIGGTIYSVHYWDYLKESGNPTKPISSATGFTFPSKGNYMVIAQYTDSLTNISSQSVTVTMDDQYEPVLNELSSSIENDTAEIENLNNALKDAMTEIENVKNELNQTRSDLTNSKKELEKTKTDLNSTIADLGVTKADLQSTKILLSMTSNNLNDTESSLSDTKKDLNDKVKTSNNYAFAGIAVGILGIIFGLVGIILARRNRPGTIVPVQPQGAQYTPAPMPATPPVQPAPPAPSPPQTGHPATPPAAAPVQPFQAAVPPPQPVQPSPLAHTAPYICVKCGASVPAGMKFCGNCGAPRQ